MNLHKNNSEFWGELCGTGLFKNLGLNGINEVSLKIFDDAYFKMYPYLRDKYLNQIDMSSDVLEIGLGFGTVGNYLFDKCRNYTGIDISSGPVYMMKKRIEYRKKSINCNSEIGNAEKLTFTDNSFDVVISIGCLHHSGKLEKSIKEVYRILKPNGKFILMIYRKPTIFMIFQKYLMLLKKDYKKLVEYKFNKNKIFKYDYDHNEKKEPAPHTDFTSKKELKNLINKFKYSKIFIENHTLPILRDKNYLLKNKLILQFFGCDLYSISIK